VITKHLRNIFKEGELVEESNVQNLHIAGSDKPVKFYNLDAIISVGYRVNSKRGTQFRQWASGILHDHLMHGWTLDRARFEQNATELEEVLTLIRKTAQSPDLITETGRGLVEIISHYTQTFLLLQRYDEGMLTEPPGTRGGVLPSLTEVRHREQVKVFLFTLANGLYRQYDLVGVGDYTPNGGGISTPMRRAMNNQSLIGQFKAVAKWTAEKSGKHFIEFDERGTTRTCNVCDHVVREGLSPNIRTWVCPACNHDHIRDENAAINGLKRILKDAREKSPKQFGLVPSSGPAMVTERWAWRVRPSGVSCTPRGMSGFSKSNRQEIKRTAWKPSVQIEQVCA
jgi:hypothetical protein